MTSIADRIRTGISQVGNVLQDGRLNIQFGLAPGQRFVVALLVGVLVGIFLALLLPAILAPIGETRSRNAAWITVVLTVLAILLVYWLLG